ncbi:winged helix DNA-binding protein [Qipengyuania sp. XHP0207]|uniref:winged helix DNA-binding protein n=1 Tax=Qipengyuania sp. XHP0207 TaxID=3038078 RepID=UPI00241C4291|nr:winged helix DNA-binding protein [Qipengyuania sp. XHP0207]MDG5747814.1 winged helix DNA-binding protein [Qipengyuania sp. XHP0207]
MMFNSSDDDLPPDALPALVTAAEKEIARRNSRMKVLPDGYFDEGPWEILLDMFVSFAKDKALSVTDAAHHTIVTTTTALRCISLLEKDGLIHRVGDAKDKRRTNLVLTAKGLRNCAMALREMNEAERRVQSRDRQQVLT